MKSITFVTKKVDNKIEIVETLDLGLADDDTSYPKEHVTNHVFDSIEDLILYKSNLTENYNSRIKELEEELAENKLNLKNLSKLK